MITVVILHKKNWIGHVVRGNSLLKIFIKGRMVGKKPGWRPRIGMIDNLKVLRENQED